MRRSIDLNLFDFQARASSWIRPARNAMNQPFFYKAANLWDQEEVIFLTSETDLDDDTDWRPIRPLGRGGFGMVCLWQKFEGADDRVVDSIAIKQQVYRATPASQATLAYGTNGLAKEALLMHQLNRFREPNIIALRGFKNNGPERLWRFYLEFAPHGDLRVLQTNYRAWNTYFPEEFLWSIFHGLAKALLRLRDGPFQDVVTGDSFPRVEVCMIHFDLKPQNIFLGDPLYQGRAGFSDYPTVKVADFGLADLTGPRDYLNPKIYRHQGTPGYHPPEQIGLTAHWRSRPEGKVRIDHVPNDQYFPEQWCRDQEMDDDFPGYRFDPSHNTWGIGKIMWEMLTLKDGDILNFEMRQLSEADYWGSMQEEAIAEIRTTREPEYSHELRELIRQCLRISPRLRPSPRELFDATLRSLTRMAEAAPDPNDGFPRGSRVFFMGNEINDMPIGQKGLPADRDIPYREQDFRVFNKRKFRDPDLESLLNGRWDPLMQVDYQEVPPIVPGGRKKRPEREAHIFMPDRRNPKLLVRKVGLAADYDDDSGSGRTSSNDDSSGFNNNGGSHGPEVGRGRGKTRGDWGGGKFRGGKSGAKTGGRLQDEAEVVRENRKGQEEKGGKDGRREGEGEAIRSANRDGSNHVNDDGLDDHPDQSRSKVIARTAKERDYGDGKGTGAEALAENRAKRPRMDINLERMRSGSLSAERHEVRVDEQGPQDSRVESNTGAHTGQFGLQLGKDSFEITRQRLVGKALADRLQNPHSQTPSRSPTRPGHSQKLLPDQPPRPEYGGPSQPPPSGTPRLVESEDLGANPPPQPSGNPLSASPYTERGRGDVPGQGRNIDQDRGSNGGRGGTVRGKGGQRGRGGVRGKGGQRGRGGVRASTSRQGMRKSTPSTHQHPPPPRRPDRDIIGQDLPTLRTQIVGGRALRPRN